jgi:hypothetical protein
MISSIEDIYDFPARLIQTARFVGWETSEWPELTSAVFRGRHDETEATRPRHARGLRLGTYPVIVSSLTLGTVEVVQEQVRALHNQMLIARSYLQAEQVVDAHIFLVCQAVASSVDSLRAVDLVERDQRICRKLVWVTDESDIAGSYQAFIDRTFLATPWLGVNSSDSAPLDQNERLIRDVLVDLKLTSESAADWLTILDDPPEDAGTLVDELVSRMRLQT